VVGKSVGLAVGSVEGTELGDGLGIEDGLPVGKFVGAPVSGHSTQVNIIDEDTGDPPKPEAYTSHILASNGGVSNHSSVSAS